jgi:hypothetical protein
VKLPVPVIRFASKNGLDLPLFNTLRLGQNWSKRVKTGQLVLIAYKDDVIATAEVDGVHCGKAADMLNTFAETNHMELHLALHDPEYMPEQAVIRRREGLKRIYGPQRFRDDSLLTVIFLRQ